MPNNQTTEFVTHVTGNSVKHCHDTCATTCYYFYIDPSLTTALNIHHMITVQLTILNINRERPDDWLLNRNCLEYMEALEPVYKNDFYIFV